MEVAELRLEREAVLAELSEITREWKLRVLAAALLEASVLEHKRAARRELLQAASRSLATLTRDVTPASTAASSRPDCHWSIARDAACPRFGARSGAARAGQPQPAARPRRTARLPRRVMPFVLDDVLGPLPLDDAHSVAQEIATLARAHPVLYLTTARAAATFPGAFRVVAVFGVE